jgi:tetraacyldisaccharide 4'-kinase
MGESKPPVGPMETSGPRIPMAAPPKARSVSLREWVVDWWGGGGGAMGGILRVLTLPLEYGFKRGIGVRNRLYDQGILPLQRAPIPVISVGNLTVGGSGKTPFSAWLVRELRAAGEKPALVAHGYGNDETVLHRRWNPDCPVIAQEDRAFGAWHAAKMGASVVVLDDGFQHRRLGRDLDIVLVASSTPEKARLLPRGPFREGFQAASRASVVVITQKGASESSLDMEMRLEPHLREPAVRASFVPDSWTDLEGAKVSGPEGEYLAVCGIGDPEGFQRTLEEATGRAGEMLTFPDHHDYAWRDVVELQHRAMGRTLVTTEKDAVKLHAFRDDLEGVRVLHLKVSFMEGKDRLWHHVQSILRPGSTS